PEPAFRRLGLEEGQHVRIAPAPVPASRDAVHAKIRGATLSAQAIADIVRDVTAYRYADMELAAFLIACASFLSMDETLALTRAMADTGERLAWKQRPIVDKHCIGGIPGNRTSMIVVPIIAAHGLTIPKTSSRAITSPAGTADTMEVFARVDLTGDEMRAVVEAHKGCVIWGGHVNLAPADDVLIAVERPLGLDTPEQMVASIMAKKVAAGSSHLLIDMPVGASAKLRDTNAALRLKKLFEFVGTRLGLVIDVAMTDGSQPIGRGVGPVLEARDVMAVLAGDPHAPVDLREKALRLAGRLLEFDPALPGGQGERRAHELLDSGAARAAFERICEAQGAPPQRAVLGDLVLEIVAPRKGIVTAMDCERIARIAQRAGAPTDKGAGVDLLTRVGGKVRKGDPLYRIHATEPADFAFAREVAEADCGITVGA
ncbi:MAG: thymidine phosphorylase family protein, partial [Alphaproteobacteria bacterium]|nr:thymidine phosphorylase family protein [Alphaproteobacteria bacterium]